MRIATRQTFLNSVSNMQTSQSNLADLQNQISTGKRLNKPSDDPVAAAQVVKLNRELAQTEKYQDNIEVTQRRLELEETVLKNMNDSMTRIRELTLQAGNDTNSDADRKTIAGEIRGLVEHLAGLMNTQDSQGEYLFSGSKGFDKPYVKDGEGNYAYVGDDGQRMIQVAPELYVPSNDSGRYLFEAAADKVEVNLLPASHASFVTGMEVVDEDKFKAFTKNTGDLQLEVRLDTTSAVPAYQYQLLDSDGTVVAGPTGLPGIAAGETVELNGLKFTVKEPAASDLKIDQEVSGVKAITVADVTEANKLQADIGKVTVTFNDATKQYTLRDASNNPVSINGQSEPFSYEPGKDLVISGFRLELGTPKTGDAISFGMPLESISPVTKVEVTNTTQYAAAANTHGDIEVQFTSATTFDLVNSSGTTILTGGSISGTPGTAALEAPAGTPLGIAITVDAPQNGDVVKLKVPAATETVLQPEQKRQNILGVAQELATALETTATDGAGRAARQKAISEALVKIDQVTERNLEARTTIGARVNSLDNTKSANQDYELFTKTALSSLEDVDLAAAISELKLEEAILQAAQASFVRIQDLSLFKFIN